MKCLVVLFISLGLAMSFPRPTIRDSRERDAVKNRAKDLADAAMDRDPQKRDPAKNPPGVIWERDPEELENQMTGNRRGYGYGGYRRPSGGYGRPSGGNSGNAGNAGGYGGYRGGYGYGGYGRPIIVKGGSSGNSGKSGKGGAGGYGYGYGRPRGGYGYGK